MSRFYVLLGTKISNFGEKNQGQKFWNSFNAKKTQAKKILAKNQFFDQSLAITN